MFFSVIFWENFIYFLSLAYAFWNIINNANFKYFRTSNIGNQNIQSTGL